MEMNLEEYAKANTVPKLEVQFADYEILPDNRVRITCEFGSWVYGGSWNTAQKNMERAQGVVSTLRYNYHWSKVPPHHISREQD